MIRPPFDRLTPEDLQKVEALEAALLETRRKLDDLLEHARNREWRDRVDKLRLMDGRLAADVSSLTDLFR